MGASLGIKKNFELIGETFNSLTVIDLQRVNGRTYAYCKCVCGNDRHIEIKSLKKIKSIDCFCEQADRASKAGAKNSTHRQSSTRLYQIWENARQRCNNKNGKNFPDYGGRGITFCNEWDDFMVFKNWAMENGYADSLTLERINVNGNYEPNNCTFITNFMQQANTRKNRFIEHNGEIFHVSEWARKLNCQRADILYHLNQGKTIQDIIDWRSTDIGRRKANKKKRNYTDEQVIEMRKLSSEKDLKELTNIFGGNRTAISRIIRGERYKYLLA